MQRKTAQNPLINLDHYSRTTNLILSHEDEKHSVCSFYLILTVVCGDATDRRPLYKFQKEFRET